MINFVKKNYTTTCIKYNNEVPYISYNALDHIPWIIHGFSTRIGGVSKDELSSLNLGMGRGDLAENVIKNHEIIAKAIGFDSKKIVSTRQTHTTNIKVVTAEDAGKGLYIEPDYADIDGMITNEKGIVLATYFADCVPLFIVDRKNKAIGLSHSGWRGTVAKMGQCTLLEMKKNYGTDPLDVTVCIGPSICRECYEVSEDVAEEFKKAFPGNESDILTDKGNGKYLLDLWRANEIIFQESGVPASNIFLPDVCTCCNNDKLFSHRATKGKRGNMAAFLSIKE